MVLGSTHGFSHSCLRRDGPEGVMTIQHRHGPEAANN
jgi:hypothetical protein